MDFSKKCLVSFGDSYTFGQNVTLESDPEEISKLYGNKITFDERMKLWRSKSNTGSYTNHLKNILKFKDAINLGIPGASNKHIYDVICSYCTLNDTSNDFFVVALTAADRDLIYTKNLASNTHSPWNFSLKTFEHHKSIKFHTNELTKHFSVNSAAEMMSYYFTDVTLYSNFINTFDCIVNLLESKKIPYVIVDTLNGICSRVDREDTVKIDNGIEPTFWDKFFNDIPGINYKNNTRIRRFKYELVNNVYPKYLDFNKIKTFYTTYPGTDTNIDIPKWETQRIINLNQFVTRYGIEILGEHSRVLSPVKGDLHWNLNGHKFAAKAISEWIQHCYE